MLDGPQGYDERTTQLLFALEYVREWARTAFGRRATADLMRRAMRREHVELKAEKPRVSFFSRADAMRHAALKRVVAVRRLGRLSPPVALVFTAKALVDPSPDVRRVAVANLGAQRHPRAVPLLIEELMRSLEQGNDVSLRAAKTALVNYQMEDLHLFVPELRNANRRLRFLVVDTIREIARRSARRGLLTKNDFPIELYSIVLQELVRDENPDVRARAAGVVRHFRDAAGEQALKELLMDENEFVRLHAVRSCADRHLPQFIPWLAQRLGDSKWRVREAAVQSLSVFGRSGEDEMCRFFVRTTDRYGSEQVAEELQRNGVVAELVRTFEDSEKSALASSVFQKLILLGKTPMLLHLAGSDDAPLGVQLHLVELLAADDHPESADFLAVLAQNEDAVVAERAQLALDSVNAAAAAAAAQKAAVAAAAAAAGGEGQVR
jgi:HEAT repeat protein